MIINNSKGTTIATDVSFADTPIKRMKGLLGRKVFATGEALVIKPCSAVHTYFMRFPIDLLFVDKDNKVIQTVPSLGSFRLTKIYFKANLVIELPSGTIKDSLTAIGDTLSF